MKVYLVKGSRVDVYEFWEVLSTWSSKELAEKEVYRLKKEQEYLPNYCQYEDYDVEEVKMDQEYKFPRYK
jgi:hypothetical protein